MLRDVRGVRVQGMNESSLLFFFSLLFQFVHARIEMCVFDALNQLNSFLYADTGNAESQAHWSDDRGERGFVFVVFRRREFVALREAILERKSFIVKISIAG